MKIINKTQNVVLAETVEKADTVLSRLKGLLGRQALPFGHAMIITQCRSIHMFFMRFAIDALFVDGNGKAVGIVQQIRPFFMSPYFIQASYVVELPAGTLARTRTKKGDIICVEDELVFPNDGVNIPG